MKIATKLNLVFLLMLALGLGSGLLSFISSRQASYQIERVGLAHQEYERYLSLSNHTYQLFKQYGDKLITGQSDGSGSKEALIEAIKVDIAAIRRLIGQKIDLVGEEKIGELETIAEIERTIEPLIAALKSLADSDRAIKDQWSTLSMILNNQIDRDFKTMIEAALAAGAQEVSEVLAMVQREQLTYQSMAATSALVALILVLGSLAMVYQQITLAVQRLLAGVRAYIDGEHQRRIKMLGRDELAEIGSAFDTLADQVTAQTNRLTDENVKLEQVVAERTQELERMLDEAKRAAHYRRRMLADVSHELRTPLTIIQGEADVALRGKTKNLDTYKDALQRTREAASHTARLVDDLLFVARVEADRVRLTVGTVDLLAVSRELAGTFTRPVILESELDQALLRGDSVRIRQAILILIENARHHGGATITLRLDTSPDGFRIAVEDDGPGLSDEEKASAFERFFRGSNAGERYAEGAGLGLPIARSIAEAHGGRIILEDRPGGGLIAALMLPAQPKLKAVS